MSHCPGLYMDASRTDLAKVGKERRVTFSFPVCFSHTLSTLYNDCKLGLRFHWVPLKNSPMIDGFPAGRSAAGGEGRQLTLPVSNHSKELGSGSGNTTRPVWDVIHRVNWLYWINCTKYLIHLQICHKAKHSLRTYNFENNFNWYTVIRCFFFCFKYSKK